MINQPVFLYVDDDESSRTVMKMFLFEIMGFKHLTIFEDSTDFMDRLESLPEQPEIFLLDICMRPFDGFVLLEMLRNHQDHKDATVIAITSRVMDGEVHELHLAGFDGAIAKPLRQDNFPYLIKRILNHEQVWYVR